MYGRVSLKKQILFSIMLLSVAFLAVELGARTYEYMLPCSIEHNEVFQNVDYFLVRWICYDTNALVHGKAPLYLIKTDQHMVTININSHGFRGPEITKEKLLDTYRIFVVGGSTTFGFGSTSDQTTIPGYLQKKFDDEKLGKKIQVINAGINGADSFREVNYIKKILLDFEPDLFIIYDGINDASGYAKQVILDDTKEDLSVTNPLKFQNYPWYRTPFVINSIFFKASNQNQTIPEANVSNFMEHGKIWEERWSDICELGKSEGFQVIVTVQPAEKSEDNSLIEQTTRYGKMLYYNKEQLKYLANELPALDDKCTKTADLRNIFVNTAEPIFYDGVHTSDFGNNLIAEKLLEISLSIVLEDK